MADKLVLKQQSALKLRFQPGATGPAGQIVSVDATTLAPGDPATVVNNGTPEAAELVFGIPEGEQGIQGETGDNGWTPELAVVTDGARRVQQVVDWFGGEGTKPAAGDYVGATGLTPTIGDAVDIRGPAGTATIPDGDKGDITTSDSGDTWTIDDDVVTNTKLAAMAPATVKANLTGVLATPVDASLTDLAAAMHLIDAATETAITSTTTLTASAFGKSFVISGLAAFTTTLPSPASHAGEMIALRVDRGSSAPVLYTLASADLIDGDASRVLWSGESCVLKSTGSTWVKIGGFSRPMTGRLKRTSDYPLPASTYDVVPFTAADSDPEGLVLAFDSTNGRFSAPRAGKWILRVGLEGAGTSMTGIALGFIKNAAGSTVPSDLGLKFIAGALGFADHGASPLLAAGDYVNVSVNIAATSPSVTISTVPAALEYAEVPQW